ncbi:DMT family transporter [Endozoicomonas numazuensis]|uniref:DMT family transporter n=1 Tax=Endozoicomonas numazuensis TaxID=1137799 RepID=UPI001F3BE6EC|nr:DMT family transporter [Endozoicomonas numazuensis]
MDKQRLKGTLCALLCVSLWAVIPVVSKLGQTTLDHHQFLFWSSLFSFVMVAGLCFVTGSLKHLRNYSVKDWGQSTVLGLLGTYLYFLLLYKGYAGGKGMEVLIVQYTWPIFVALLSVVILRETLNGRKILSLLLGFAAIILILTKGQLQALSLNDSSLLLWVMAGAICFALFSVFSKRIKLEANSLMLVFFGVATLASFISMLVFSEFILPDSRSLLIVIISGVLVNGLSDVLWLWALRRTEASFLAPFIFLTPLLSTLYMLLIFSEQFLPVYGVSLVLIIFAGVINTCRPGSNEGGKTPPGSQLQKH